MVCEVSICGTGLLELVDTYRPGDVLQYYDTYEYDDQGNLIGASTRTMPTVRSRVIRLRVMKPFPASKSSIIFQISSDSISR